LKKMNEISWAWANMAGPNCALKDKKKTKDRRMKSKFRVTR
jgi:hypothetical protein